MMWPPMLLVLRIESPGKKRLNLWLPLLLLWPLVLCLALLLLPLLVIVALCLRTRQEGRRLLRMIGQGYAACCALRGLRVEVRQGAEQVKIICL